MRRFVEGMDRGQSTLFPECLEDWITEDNSVRVIDVFVDELDLAELGFDGVAPEVSSSRAPIFDMSEMTQSLTEPSIKTRAGSCVARRGTCRLSDCMDEAGVDCGKEPGANAGAFPVSRPAASGRIVPISENRL